MQSGKRFRSVHVISCQSAKARRPPKLRSSRSAARQQNLDGFQAFFSPTSTEYRALWLCCSASPVTHINKGLTLASRRPCTFQPIHRPHARSPSEAGATSKSQQKNVNGEVFCCRADVSSAIGGTASRFRRRLQRARSKSLRSAPACDRQQAAVQSWRNIRNHRFRKHAGFNPPCDC